MTFEFATAGRILFGRGKSQQIPALARGLGRRALVVLGGSDRGRPALTQGLGDAGVPSVVFNVSGEPTTHLVDRATGIARAEGCDLVISAGGGSVIDVGKAVAALLANPGVVRDYLELAGGGKPLLERGVPFIAVPTTAGTGAEVTRNAVLDVPEQKLKASLRSPHLLARLAVVDPELTLSLPPAITAYTGMDALTQLIEPFVSSAANPMTDRWRGPIATGPMSRPARTWPSPPSWAGSPWRMPGSARCTGSPASWAGSPARPMAPSAPGSSRSSWRPTFAPSPNGATRPSCSDTLRSPGP
jgi:alcohol dehydrogenase class IV